MQTITLNEARQEYLDEFCKWRVKWNMKQLDGTPG